MGNSNDLKVSVIMNVHNGDEFISEAILSVVKQTYQNWELIVWDNNSTDKTFENVSKFKDKRISYFKSNMFDKLYAARNKAIRNTRGDLITFLDSDDIWLPNKLERQVKTMSNKKFDFCYSNFFQIDNNSKKIFPSKAYYSTLPSGKIYNNLLRKYRVGILTLCLRKNSLKKYNISFDPSYSIIGDMVFVLELSKLGYCDASQECLACYRTHQGNLSKKKVLMQVLEMRKWFKELKKDGEWNKFLFKELENLTNYQRAKGLITKINFSQLLKMIFKIKNIYLILRFIIHYFIFKINNNNIFRKKK